MKTSMKPIRPALLLTLLLAAMPAFAHDHDDDTSKVNGSIHAEAGRSYGSLDTVNGGIRIDAKATTGSAETVNGGIEVGDGARTGNLETVNGGIRLGREVQVDGHLEAVNGSLFADRGSRIREDVENVNGGIGLVDTDVGGGIHTVRGDVTVGVGSHVKGGLRVEKPQGNSFSWGKQRPPRIVIGPDAVVEGALVFEHPVVLYVHKSAKIGPVSGATAKMFDTATAPKD